MFKGNQRQLRRVQKMKNKILAILISMLLVLPVTAETIVGDEPISEDGITSVQNLDEDTSERVTDEAPQVPYKQPISKKKIIKKFLLAMGGVAGSSLLLYYGLTAYNSIRSKFKNRIHNVEGETPLETPVDYESAVRTFLDKTKW